MRQEMPALTIQTNHSRISSRSRRLGWTIAYACIQASKICIYYLFSIPDSQKAYVALSGMKGWSSKGSRTSKGGGSLPVEARKEAEHRLEKGHRLIVRRSSGTRGEYRSRQSQFLHQPLTLLELKNEYNSFTYYF